MALVQMGAKPAPPPYTGPPVTFPPGGAMSGQPVPTKLPNGQPNPYANPNSRQYQSFQKALAKRQAAMNRVRKNRGRGPQAQASDPSGTGGPNDPAWQHLADLYNNGLPG